MAGRVRKIEYCIGADLGGLRYCTHYINEERIPPMYKQNDYESVALSKSITQRKLLKHNHDY